MSSEVLIIGGGLVGLSTAWKAAAAGHSVVALVDPDRPEASRAAVGGLSFCPADAIVGGDEAMIRLAGEAKRTFPDFISTLEAFSGVWTQHRKWPTLMVAHEAADEALMDRVEFARGRVGLSSIRLSASECQELEPGLAPAIRGGLLIEDHDQVDSGLLLDSVTAACVKAGVDLRTGRVRRILKSGGRVSGVELTSGEELPAARVVVAAGAWSGEIDGLPSELRNAVRPVAGQVVIVEGRPGQQLPRHDLRTARAYMVTRSDGSILVGATKEDKGYDHAPTARNVRVLLQSAESLWPPFGECQWRETRVGMRPLSADQRPLVGRTSIDGVFAATGHFRNGIMFAASTADAIVSMLGGNESPPVYEPFSPARVQEAA